MTASIVPGAISWPCSISSASSWTTASAVSTASLVAVEREHVAAQEHVAVEVALERPQHGVAAAGELARNRVVELELLTQPMPRYDPSASRTRAETRLPSARPPVRPITTFITWPMSLASLGAGLRDRVGDDRVELGVVELGREVALDQLGLGLLLVGQLRAPAVAELLGRLEPPLALAAQHRQLVVAALLGGLLELGQHEPERGRALALG